MPVNIKSSSNGLMSQNHLHGFYRNPCHNQMTGKSMAETVHTHTFQSCFFAGFLKSGLHTLYSLTIRLTKCPLPLVFLPGQICIFICFLGIRSGIILPVVPEDFIKLIIYWYLSGLKVFEGL